MSSDVLIKSLKLNVALVSALLHARYGGPSEVLRLHARGLSSKADVTVYGIATAEDRDSITSSVAGLKIFKPGFPYRWFYSSGLYRSLLDESQSLDVLHAHMLWDFPVFAAWKASIKYGHPLIITPHGSLNNRWRYKGIVKTVYRKVLLDDILSDTACIHVLNKEEELACYNYGIRCPVRIIPNGIPESSFSFGQNPLQAIEKWPELSGRRVMLYLGRLWHGKGLDILPDAWARVLNSVKRNNWLLVFAGPDYRGYQAVLEERVRQLGLSDTVLFTGPVYDQLKLSLLSASTFYVLPSHGEGFSMALLEAVAAKRPALFTDKCNFTELAACGGGWEVADTSAALADALRELLEKDDSYFEAAGIAGWAFAKERYSLEVVSDQLIDMYRTAIG